jgi:hypothetical protein
VICFTETAFGLLNALRAQYPTPFGPARHVASFRARDALRSWARAPGDAVNADKSFCRMPISLSQMTDLHASASSLSSTLKAKLLLRCGLGTVVYIESPQSASARQGP